MTDKLLGYRGKVLEILRKADLQVGDLIKVTDVNKVYEGTLMPRFEMTDDRHIVIKLKSGYNIGVKISPSLEIETLGVGKKPTFASSPSVQEKENLPTIAIISTGGTIASRIDYRTGAVRPALTTNDLLSVVPMLSEIANLRTELLYSMLSENIKPSHWTAIAKIAARHIREGMDGVVICHGTDTMAYTSAALSFALQNTPVPVILVGSQRSSDRPSSDAAMNLINAVRAAASVPIAEVMIGMHETMSDTATVLHRGTRVRKIHTSRRDAFRSLNTDPLARVESGNISILLNDYKKRDQKKKLVLKPNFKEKVALIKFHPGLNPYIFEWYVDEGYFGIILEGTGLGHLGEYCFSRVKKAMESGLFIGMCSQCVNGRVNMKVYDTGRELLKLGVIPLEDMLPETAMVKLSWSFGQTKDLDDVKRLMTANIVGEITSRSIC